MQDSQICIESNAETLLDLNDLRIFTYVAVLCSFSAAAEELKISKSSVSRSIVRLEQLLKSQLLNRTTRKVKLTRSGAVLKDRGVEIMKRIDETIGYVGSVSLNPQGQLVFCVAANAGLTEQVQEVVLARFLERYNKVSIVLRFTTQNTELRAESVDIAISSGPSHPPGSSKFITLQRWLCASPAYLNRHNAIEMVDDLSAQDIIATNDGETPYAPSLGNLFELNFFRNAHLRLNTNDMMGARRLAIRGFGIACLPEHICKADVRRGDLVRILPDLEIPPLELNVSYPSKRSVAPAVMALVEILKASLTSISMPSSGVPEK